MPLSSRASAVNSVPDPVRPCSPEPGEPLPRLPVGQPFRTRLLRWITSDTDQAPVPAPCLLCVAQHRLLGVRPCRPVRPRRRAVSLHRCDGLLRSYGALLLSSRCLPLRLHRHDLPSPEDAHTVLRGNRQGQISLPLDVAATYGNNSRKPHAGLCWTYDKFLAAAESRYGRTPARPAAAAVPDIPSTSSENLCTFSDS